MLKNRQRYQLKQHLLNPDPKPSNLSHTCPQGSDNSALYKGDAQYTHCLGQDNQEPHWHNKNEKQ